MGAGRTTGAPGDATRMGESDRIPNKPDGTEGERSVLTVQK